MSDLIIHAEGLSKLYKLYTKSHYRFLDMMGLLRRTDAYQEHWAIRDVNLKIRRGEKVAFIGRNGAGKSTLLRLITGVTQPTSGKFTVSQGAHALLQIGTGFHPDFTGRENALAYLAHLAVVGEEADAKLEEIIAFSELEEYIDQPVKTYSSGMMARLMFATSTAISPELLVLDEILGVGDAYFGNKSFERIRELSEEGGTTVLLVSHDVYSAAKLCSRMVWLDRGNVLLDGKSDEVIRAYEQSVRLQEESRLRTKALATRRAGQCLLEFSSAEQSPVRGKLLIKSVRLLSEEGLLAEHQMNPAGENFLPSSGFEDVNGDSGLRIMSEVAAIKRCRLTLDLTQKQIELAADRGLQIEVVYYSNEQTALIAELWFKERCCARGELVFGADQAGPAPQINNAWPVAQAAMVMPAAQLTQQSNVYGSARIWLNDITLYGADRVGKFVFSAGETICARCRYQIEAGLGELPVEFMFAFHRDGVTDIARLTVSDVIVSRENGDLRFEWPDLRMGIGTYTLTVFVVKPGYFENNNGKFYSINDDVYFAFNRGIEFVINGDGGIFAGANAVLPMRVSVNGAVLEG